MRFKYANINGNIDSIIFKSLYIDPTVDIIMIIFIGVNRGGGGLRIFSPQKVRQAPKCSCKYIKNVEAPKGVSS